MTKHILVIGNSHIASIKNGWELLKDNYQANFSLSFLGARRDGIATLQADNDLLYSEDETVTNSFLYTFGHKSVDLASMAPDAILMYGMDMYFPSQFIKECQSNLYTADVQRIAFADMLNHSWAYRTIAKIRKIYFGPMYVSIPFKAENTQKSNVNQAAKTEDVSKFDEQVIFANTKFFSSVGLEYITQPSSTLNLRTMTTQPEYSKGSTRLAVGFENDNEQHAPNDIVHMNAEFGALFLKQFFSRLDKR